MKYYIFNDYIIIENRYRITISDNELLYYNAKKRIFEEMNENINIDIQDLDWNNSLIEENNLYVPSKKNKFYQYRLTLYKLNVFEIQCLNQIITNEKYINELKKYEQQYNEIYNKSLATEKCLQFLEKFMKNI